MKRSEKNLSAAIVLALAVLLGVIILAACANSSSNNISGALATPTVDHGPAETATAVERSIEDAVAATVMELKIQTKVEATVQAARTATAAAQPTVTPTATSTPARLFVGQAPSATPTFSPTRLVRAQDLGICINPWIEGHAPTLEQLDELGVGWVRFVAYGAELPRLGDVLAQYKGAGLRTILVVNQETFPQKEDSPWLYVERFSALFEGLVRSHGSLVDAWEVWNEPEDRQMWKHLSEETYSHLLELCFNKAKKINSGTIILATGYLDFLRLREVPRDGGAFHPYGHQAEGYPPTFERYYEDLRVPFLHADVPLWLTEFGASLESLRGLGVEPEEAQAQYLESMVGEVRRLGPEVVKVAVWFSYTDLDNGEEKKLYGLVDKDGNRRKAYYALAQLARE